MNTIIINGKKIQVSGDNIVITNDKVLVNGKVVEKGLSGTPEIQFIGNLANLTTHGSATVNGHVHGDVDAGGSVSCGDVGGNIDAGGSVKCGIVHGSIDAGGSVKTLS